MNYLSNDHLIIYTITLVTLFLGLRAGQGAKDLRDYAIANKSYGVVALTFTILATYITGSKGMGYVGYVFDDGILPVISIVICGVLINFWAIARYIAPRMRYFRGCLTLSELMGKCYGRHVRIFMGIVGLAYSVAIVALQINWFSYIGALVGAPPYWSMVAGGLFITLYAATGGMRAIVATDILQFITIIILIPFVAYVLLDKVGGVVGLFKNLPQQTFDVLHHPSAKDYLVYVLWDLFPAYPLSFPFIQRMLMAKDGRQIARSYYLSMTFLTLFFLLLTLVGLCATVLKATTHSNLPQQGSSVFVYLVQHYLPSGAKGVMAAGFIAGVMSTADSFLHAAGLSLAHDVVQPLLKRRRIVTNELRLARYLTALLGLLALGLALAYEVLPRVQYGGVDLGKGLNMVTEIGAFLFTLPLIGAIMGLQVNASLFWTTATITLTTFFATKLLMPHDWVIPLSVLANLSGFFGGWYLMRSNVVRS